MCTTFPSWSTEQLETSSANIRQLCQFQIERLSETLPVLDVWLVCWNHLENRHDTLSFRQNNQLRLEIETYLSSERWISENLPFLELKSLSADSDDTQVYVCGLGKTDTHWDYLFLLTEKHLSHLQQNVVKDDVQLLQKYLTLYQENLRQRAKIKLLEEALQQAEHQLKNPLALIQVYAQTIVLSAESKQQQHQADCIRQTAGNIAESLESLLHCGQQDALVREHHDLRVLLGNVLTILSPAMEQKQLYCVQPTAAVSVMVDGWQFEQVLQNLLDNAIHHSPLGGTITVHWQVYQQTLCISIRDQGPGLGDLDSNALFRPFYTKRPGGTGLGLAIAKKIVLDHQGSIEAETLPEGGAKFSIFLPC
ncbi:MAG: HAMP domain-containing sensor histidine kinase [Cyanobacteria bacterium P01_D01_bin.156]